MVEIAKAAPYAWFMATNIKNDEVEGRVAELAADTGETRTVLTWLRTEVWPTLPPDQLGQPISREEEAGILGYGPEGV